jgi:hypothetical protein
VTPSTTTPSPSPAALAAYYTTAQPTLCVSVESLQSSIMHGQTAEWAVSVWAVNGNIPATTIQLITSPATVTPEFSFGCGSYDGTASCNLGSVYSGSTSRQVIASVAVPATATAVTSVQLTVTGSATGLTASPSAAVSVPVQSGTATTSGSSATGTGTGTGTGGTGTGAGSSSVSPLPVGSLPTIGGGSSSSLSPGGNAGGLFPTINPSAVPNPAAAGESARQVANTEALPIGTPVVDAQLLGLGALGVAFLLAATRFSVRRRPATALAGGQGGQGAALAAGTAPDSPAKDSTAKDSTATVGLRPTSAAWSSAGPAAAEAESPATEAPAGEAGHAAPVLSTDDTTNTVAMPAITAEPDDPRGDIAGTGKAETDGPE